MTELGPIQQCLCTVQNWLALEKLQHNQTPCVRGKGSQVNNRPLNNLQPMIMTSVCVIGCWQPYRNNLEENQNSFEKLYWSFREKWWCFLSVGVNTLNDQLFDLLFRHLRIPEMDATPLRTMLLLLLPPLIFKTRMCSSEKKNVFIPWIHSFCSCTGWYLWTFHHVITTSHILKLISKHRRWIVRRRLKRGFGDSIGGFGRDCRSVSTASQFFVICRCLLNWQMMAWYLCQQCKHSYWLVIK